MDYVIVKQCRRSGYELLDQYGDYLGCALTLAQARRFAEAAGVPLYIEPEVVETQSSHARRYGWLARLRFLITRRGLA